MVGSVSNRIQCFSHAHLMLFSSCCASVLGGESVSGRIVKLFVSFCARFPISSFVCAHLHARCVPTNMTHECTHTHTHSCTRRVSSGQLVQMPTKEAPGCIVYPLVQQGAIYLNVAMKGGYLHEMRAVSGKWRSL